jgi:site-specific DNA-methyltransferase (adenine-specific)
MRKLKPGSVDLVVTSPPYDNLRTYEGTCNWTFDVFKDVAAELVRVLKPGGVIVWVVGDATVNGSETGSSFKQALHFKELGLNIHDTMIYSKNAAPYDPKCNRYWQSFEYMLVFSKGRVTTCNYLTEPCVGAGKRKSSNYGQRNPDGSLRTDRNSDDRLVKETKVRQNIWFYTPGDRVKGHPAQYPLQLAVDHILSWSNGGIRFLILSWAVVRQALQPFRMDVNF